MTVRRSLYFTRLNASMSSLRSVGRNALISAIRLRTFSRSLSWTLRKSSSPSMSIGSVPFIWSSNQRQSWIRSDRVDLGDTLAHLLQVFVLDVEKELLAVDEHRLGAVHLVVEPAPELDQIDAAALGEEARLQ